jgi:hypothetical protein
MVFACKYFNSKHKHISQLSILAMSLFDWPIIKISYQSFLIKTFKIQFKFPIPLGHKYKLRMCNFE